MSIIEGVSVKVSSFSDLEKILLDNEVECVEEERTYHAILDTSPKDIGADVVWTYITDKNQSLTGIGKTIADLDTGVDYKHGDLGGGCFGKPECKVIGGYDFINNDNDPMDDNSHGTHVAAIAAGNGFFRRIAPDAKILGYKVLGANGSGGDSTIIRAIERALDPNQDGDISDRADVITTSLGAPGNPENSISLAVDRASDAGSVVKVATGNAGPEDSTIASPGTSNSAITVAASCKQSNMASCNGSAIAPFSSRGPVIYNGIDYQKPDISAPGVGICAALLGSNNGSCGNSTHVRYSGTSMAAPHIAGAAALISQRYPDLNPSHIKALLKSTATSFNLPYNIQGAGLVNLVRAIPGETKFSFNPSLLFKDVIPSHSTTQVAQTFTLHANTSRNVKIHFAEANPSISIIEEGSVVTLASNTPTNVTLHFVMNHDTLPSGVYHGQIKFVEDDTTIGIIPIHFKVQPQIDLNSPTINYGNDAPNNSNWISPSQMIQLSNRRTDKAITFQIISPSMPEGIVWKSDILSGTLSPSQSLNFNSFLQVDNSKVSNGSYEFSLAIKTDIETIPIKIKFVKFYQLTLHRFAQGEFDPRINIVIVHNRKDTRYIFTRPQENDIQVLSNSSGPFDVFVAFEPASTSSRGTLVKRFWIKEGISLDTGSTVLPINYQDVIYKSKFNAVDSTGKNVLVSYREFYHEYKLKPQLMSYFDSYGYTGDDVTLNHYTSVSSNYRLSTMYSAPSLASENMYFYYHTSDGINSDQSKVIDPKELIQTIFKMDIANYQGPLSPQIWYCNKILNFCSSPYQAKNPTALSSSFQSIWTYVPSGIFFAQESDTLKNGCSDAQVKCPQYMRSVFIDPITLERRLDWYNSNSNVIKNAKENIIYQGLGPVFFEIGIRTGTFVSTITKSNTGYLFLRQDYTPELSPTISGTAYFKGNATGHFKFDPFIPQTFSGTFPGRNLFPWLPGVSFDQIDIGPYYYYIDNKPYYTKTIFKLSNFVQPVFGIRSLEFQTEGQRSQIWAIHKSNKITFSYDTSYSDFQSVTAQISSSIDFKEWTDLTVIPLGDNETYSVALPPKVLVSDQGYIRLIGKSVFGNETHSTFEMPIDRSNGPSPNPSPLPSATPTHPGDIIPPYVPKNLAGLAQTCTSVALEWNPSQDNPNGSGLAGYKLYREDKLIYIYDPNTTYVQDTLVQNNTVYHYQVSAFDRAGNESERSRELIVKTPECQ